jgi:exoribonuclease R
MFYITVLLHNSGGGALAISRMKLSFKFTTTVVPDGDNIVDIHSMVDYPIRDSNRLIEEYMLLANYLVARRSIMAMPEFDDSTDNNTTAATNTNDSIDDTVSQSQQDTDTATASNVTITTKSKGPGALLRRHPPPLLRQLTSLVATLKSCDLVLDATSSASLQASILAISEACGPDSILPQVVDTLLAGPMKPAQCK